MVASYILQLLSFDEVNVWIFEKEKKNHWYPKGKVNIIFYFNCQLIHTFTESKDNNCFILYFE